MAALPVVDLWVLDGLEEQQPPGGVGEEAGEGEPVVTPVRGQSGDDASSPGEAASSSAPAPSRVRVLGA